MRLLYVQLTHAIDYFGVLRKKSTIKLNFFFLKKSNGLLLPLSNGKFEVPHHETPTRYSSIA
jgi:hypothetical protein